jgi:hypothetical protein
LWNISVDIIQRAELFQRGFSDRLCSQLE